MKNHLLHIIGILSLLALNGTLACAAQGPLTPELAAKTEVVRKQQQQRVTPAQRKAAAEALKLQREKIDQAQKGVAPVTADVPPSK
jgi:cell division protein ZapA (FtsZ GTPase activity inhibitor)